MPKTAATITRSFRISQDAFDALKEVADRKEITVNTLVNQLFTAHRDFDRFFERMGVVKISISTFGLLLSAGSEERIAEAGRQAGMDIPKAIILAKDGLLSFQTICDFLRMMSHYANLFEYNEVESPNGQSKIITLMHHLGNNGSLFLSQYAKAIFAEAKFDPKVSSSEHSIIIEVPL